MKQVRNTFEYTVPSSLTVTAAAVALGVIMGMFTALASPTTARVLPVSTSPISAVMPLSTILVKAVTLSVSSPLLSYITSSILLPFMPPFSFTLLKYSSAPLRTPRPYAAYSPVCGPSTPIFMVFAEASPLCAACPEQPASINSIIKAASANANVRFTVMVIVLLIFILTSVL